MLLIKLMNFKTKLKILWKKIINKLDELQLTDLVYNMYDRYHIESLDNAYKDIDNLIRERETM